MKAKAKGIVSGVTGRIGSIDRTIGREGGLSVNFQERRAGMTLTSKTAATRGGSEARHERSRVYCDCDQEYKALYETKTDYLNTYYRTAHNLSSICITNYQTFMKLCLAARLEKAAFVEFSYFSRYLIPNMTGEDWNEKVVRLVGIPTKRGDGKDVQVFELDFDHNIAAEIPHKVDAAGSILIKVTQAAGGQWLFVDVYSYSDYEHIDSFEYAPEWNPYPIQEAAYTISIDPNFNTGGWGELNPANSGGDVRYVYIRLPKPNPATSQLLMYMMFGRRFPHTLNTYKTGSFGEYTITWNNQPPLGQLISSTVTRRMGWVAFNLPNAGEYIAIVMMTGGTGEEYASDDNSDPSIRPVQLAPIEPPTFAPMWQKQIGTT